VTLSCALRTLKPELRRHHVVLAVNPDGCQLGLRANARGVDLNRNFPAANWKEGETVYRWNSAAEQRDVVLLTGEKPGSEPETQALCQLIHQIHPAWVVSFHDPLACIEDPGHSAGTVAGRRFACRWWAASATKRPAPLAAGAPISACPASPPSFRRLRRRSDGKYLPAMMDLLRWQAQR
jgi:protein MpaA